MKKSKVLSVILAAALAVSGCAGGSAGSGTGTASGGGTESGSENAGSGDQRDSAPGEAGQGEYARAMAKRSQSSEDSDPTISKVSPEGEAGNGGTSQNGAAAQNGGGEKKVCTVMIYMVGSNLESRLGNATKDLEEIDGAGLNFDNYNVIAYTGGSTRWVGNVPCDRNCVLDLSLEGEERIVAQTNGNANMGLPETLSAFLNYCGENYPADHNVLILWDHGGGPLWGYGVDELYDSDSLLLNEMRTAMDASVFKGGADGKKLDLVGFDACLMGSLECMTIWQDYADYYVGSEELEPGDGWNYEFLKVLDEPGTYSGGHFAREVGSSILTSFEKYYNGKKSSTYNPDLTLAFVDLGGITALNAALDVLAEKMADGVENGEYASFMKDRSEIKSFGMTRDPNGVVSFYYDLVDVGNLAEHMEAFYPKEAAAVKAALGAAVADKYANIDDAAGMTLYYPYKNKGQFEQLNEYYASFLKTEGYSRFLDAAGEYFLKSKSWDWNLGEPTDQGDEYTLQLTHEQLDNMTETTYTVLTSNGIFGGYKPIMENCKIEPDKNGVLHLDKNVQLAVLRNGEQAAILRAVEVESDRKRKVYDTKGISLRSDVLYANRINDLEAADVTIRLSKDKKSGEVQIQNIELEDNSSGIAGGKNSVDLMNWEGLAVLTGPDLIVPARDESGRIRPYEEWTRPGSTTWSAVPVSSEVELDVLDISEFNLEDTFCQIEIRDINGEKYASELVPIGSDDRKKVTEPMGSGQLTFAIYEDHAEVIGYEGREAKIVVPDTVEGVPVTKITGRAFSWYSVFDAMGYDPVTEVVLPDTITSIGAGAFAYCWDLQKINVPADLKEVGNEAFSCCSSLEEFELPDGVEKIGKCAFAYCESLKRFRIPKELTVLEEGVFMQCSMLEEFTGGTEPDGNNPVLDADGAVYSGDGKMLLAYPGAAGDSFAVKEGTEEIGYSAFDGASLKEVILPEGLRKIGNYAFYDCTSLQVPVFPEGLEELGMHCFDTGSWSFDPEEIPKEQSVIYIPASLEKIGDHAFDLFVGTRFEVSGDNRHYSGVDGALMNKAGDTVYYIATDPELRAIYPEGTVEFSEAPMDVYDGVNTLAGNVVRQIYLPASMTKFPKGLYSYKNSDHYAIYHCPAGSEAEKFALEMGVQLTDEMERPEKTVEVPTQKGRMSFDLYADHAVLWGYTGEDEVLEIPAEAEGLPVTGVGNGIEPVFAARGFPVDCGRPAPNVKKIVIPEGVTDLNGQALNDLNWYSEVVLPSTLKKLGKEAVYPTTTFNSLPEGIEVLEEECIGWDSDVPFIVTPNMRYIDGAFTADGVSAFAQKGENENYSVRDGALFTADGSALLRYPAGSTVEEFSVPRGTVSVEDKAFYASTNLKKVRLPGSLTRIGDEAFANCEGLKAVTFDKDTSLESIGQAAFMGCKALTEVSLPPAKEIMSSAFRDCESLKTVHFSEGTRSIGASAFQQTAVADPKFPDSLVKIGDYVYRDYKGPIRKGSAKTIRIPARMNEIGMMAFDSIGNTAFEVDPASESFSSADGLLLDKEKNTLYLCPAGKKGKVTVPEGTTAIMYGAFSGAKGVTDVEIPDSVVYISSGNFEPDIFSEENEDGTKPYPIKIHCSKGSYAEFFAVSQGIPYEAK